MTAGETALRAREVEPLCLRWEDADDDIEPEWVGLYLRPADPPSLEGFVLDGEAWHELRAPSQDDEGLGSYPACRLEVRDVNTDGRTEILIYGRSAEDVDLLHIFVWRRDGYTMFASFRGDAGVEVANVDGVLPDDILARYDAGRGLAWEAVHTWDGAHYGWTWERYSWYFADRPHAYLTHDPEHSVISFYLALGDRDLPGAFRLLSSATRAGQPYEAWADGFHTMLDAEVGAVDEIERTSETARVAAQVRSFDNEDGYVVARLWEVTWSLVREGEGWHLDQSTSELLERWEAPYFP